MSRPASPSSAAQWAGSRSSRRSPRSVAKPFPPPARPAPSSASSPSSGRPISSSRPPSTSGPSGRCRCSRRWRCVRWSGRSSLGLMILVSVDAGAASVLPLPPARPAASARSAARAGRRDKRMTIRSDEAAATLAEIERVVAKVKQSRVYRAAALITILWGVVNLARGTSGRGLAGRFRDALVPGRSCRRRRDDRDSSAAGHARAGGFPFRFLAAFAIVYGFGWVWSQRHRPFRAARG